MQPPQSIEEIKAGLETTEKGGVRQSIRNCLTVFQRDPLLSGAILHCIDSFFAVYFCIGVTLSNFDEAHDIIYLLVLPVMVSLRPSE